ncbi:MAG: UDP-N-acetylmuramoyl-tripeptide--D-alanyl-D-alanine ligase [Gallionella sp.]|nr:UDP-N-acetylmuramoyl-tripeptide--D-alanyl-D-alanine ligase [Gallionella sp.]
MMNMSQIAKALGAVSVGPEVIFTGVSTDSRHLAAGDLFVALRGENFDAYDFVAGALQSGAVAALVNADSYAANPAAVPAGAAVLAVPDTRLALGRLAAFWRSQCPLRLAAITGSNGKTTVKEMLASILRAAAGEDAVLATRGNLNNDIGMPLTLLRLQSQHQYAVIEMGMNHPGEIDYLTQIARPDVALVNNASGAHLAGLGSIEAVARAKGEIFSGLSESGTAVINADDPYAPLWRELAGTRMLLEFALENPASVQGRWRPNVAGSELEISAPTGDFSVALQVPGEHNARNALAAAALAVALDIPTDAIARGLTQFSGVSGRLQHKSGQQGVQIIDDTYNANPASMLAAIAVLAQYPGRRVLVLGDMGELGGDAAGLHAQVGEAAKQAGIDALYALGELSRGMVRAFGEGGQHFDDAEALKIALRSELKSGITLLVKGSRFMKMERIVQFCMAQEETCCSH